MRNISLGEFADVQTGPFGSLLHASDYEATGVPIITVEHLGDNHLIHENLPLVGASDYIRLCKYALRVGDIVFSRVGAIDRRAFVSEREEGWLFSGRLLRVRADSAVAQSRYLSWLLGFEDVQRWVANHAVGSTMPCLNTSILASVPLKLAPPLEQHRIAEVLDTADELVRQTESLIAALKHMRQGLLHDLLTRGLDTNGELRNPAAHPEQFLDSALGRIPQQWKVVPLGQPVPRAEYGISVSLEDGAGIPVLRMNNLRDGEVDLTELKYSCGPQARNLLLRPRDVLFNRTNSIEHVGRTSIWRGQLEQASFASYLVRLVCDESQLTPEYLNLWMNHPAVQLRIRRFATPGVHQVNINPTNLRKTLIALPSSLEEQVEITGLLDVQDAHIGAEEAYREKLVRLKKGLMQDLLTGRVRVPVPEPEPELIEAGA